MCRCVCMARTETSAGNHALPHTAERLAPWLAAPILIGGALVVVALSGAEPSFVQRSAMILCLCGSIAVACVVATRSSREADVAGREERERPALHELTGVDDSFGSARRTKEVGPSVYLESMNRWAAAMLELTEHASATPAAIEAGAVAELKAASDDTRELRDLLDANATTPLKVSAIRDPAQHLLAVGGGAGSDRIPRRHDGSRVVSALAGPHRRRPHPPSWRP